MSILQEFLFPPPPSLYITAMSVVGFVSLSFCGLAEVRGKHLQYSKFWNVQSKGKGKEGIKLSSRAGMLLLYTPAFVAGAVSLAFYPSPSLRFWLLSWALTIHFLKRVLERSNGEAQEAAKKESIDCLKLLEGELEDKPFYGCKNLGYVDVVLVPFACWFYTYETNDNFNIENECPKLISLVKRCMEKESVSKVLPDPHKVYNCW